MRVYFDASVIIAALLSPTGGSAQLFKFLKAGLIIGITSQTVIEEVLEEKHLPKIKRSRSEIEEFITKSGLIIRRAITSEDIALYQGIISIDDAHLIAGSKLTKCEYLVTLDKKHLLAADIREKFLPLNIVSPKELLQKHF